MSSAGRRSGAALKLLPGIGLGLGLAASGLLGCGKAIPELTASPINHKVLQHGNPAAPYRVILMGHPYGMYTDKERIAPAKTLLANLSKLESTSPRFYALLGDNVRFPKQPYVDQFKAQLTDAVAVPVFAIPGEHDLFEGPENYERLFGPADYRVRTGQELFLFLNSGKFETELSWRQRGFVQESLQLAEESDAIKNVIVLLHKVAWVRLERYAALREMINNDRKGDLWDQLYPALRALARKKGVFVGAGDIGHKSYSFFLDRNPEDGITYFATGLADRRTDSVAQLDFPGDGSVEISAISLTAEPVVYESATLAGFAASTMNDQPIPPTSPSTRREAQR